MLTVTWTGDRTRICLSVTVRSLRDGWSPDGDAGPDHPPPADRSPIRLHPFGFGETLIAGCTAPALTSVGFPYAEASREAVRLLLDRIAMDSEVTSTVVLRRILIERESCCGPTQGSRVRA
ncbi:MAG: substrate-binding domain-containing protein [Armatimonadota bacterium]